MVIAPGRGGSGVPGGPSQGREQLLGGVGEDLPVLLVAEAVGQRQAQFGGAVEGRVGEDPLDDLLAGAVQVALDDDLPRTELLGCEGAVGAGGDVVRVVLALSRGRRVGRDDHPLHAHASRGGRGVGTSEQVDVQLLRFFEGIGDRAVADVPEQEVQPVFRSPADRAHGPAADPHPVPQPGHVRLDPGDLASVRGGQWFLGEWGAREGLQEASDQFVRIRGGVDVRPPQRGEEIGVRGRRADPDVQSVPRQCADRREVLGQAERVLDAQRDHVGLQGDVRGALGRGGQERESGGDPAFEVALADPGNVEAQVLAEFDQLEHRFQSTGRVVLGVGPGEDETRRADRRWRG
jgi:hypothetical protein